MVSRLLIAALWSLTLLPLAGASNPPDKLNRLLSSSPFGQARAGVAAGNGAADPLEFRAVLEENGNKLFSIYETVSHRSTWVELNDPANGFSVKGYNPSGESVTVEYQNKSLTLPIKRAAAVAQAAPMPVVGPGPMPGNPAVQAAPSPVDQQRLQQIQEEIRRRRALRQQAGGPPAGQPGTESSGQVPAYSTGPQPMPSNPPGPPVPAKP